MQQLGHDLIFLGMIEAGEDYYHKAAYITAKNGLRIDLTQQRALMRAKLQKGEYETALTELIRERDRLESLGINIRLSEVNYDIFFAHLHLGNYDTVASIAKQNLAICQKSGYALYLYGWYMNLCLVYLGLGEYEKALHYLEQRYEPRQTNFPDDYIEEECAYVLLRLEEYDKSRLIIRRALENVITSESKPRLLWLLPAISLHLSALGQMEYAIEIYTLALTFPFIANSRWFYDVAGRRIEKAAESLPPDVVAAAKARGRELDLWETAKELLVELGSEESSIESCLCV
ncbi:MAG: hypothetical protein P1S60_04220 [Anaerolineae bacterium]|nr:hypothetical protein [Anaerolineae bacterium]